MSIESVPLVAVLDALAPEIVATFDQCDRTPLFQVMHEACQLEEKNVGWLVMVSFKWRDCWEACVEQDEGVSNRVSVFRNMTAALAVAVRALVKVSPFPVGRSYVGTQFFVAARVGIGGVDGLVRIRLASVLGQKLGESWCGKGMPELQVAVSQLVAQVCVLEASNPDLSVVVSDQWSRIYSRRLGELRGCSSDARVVLMVRLISTTLAMISRVLPFTSEAEEVDTFAVAVERKGGVSLADQIVSSMIELAVC